MRDTGGHPDFMIRLTHPITDKICAPCGSRLLYVYEDPEQSVVNAVSYTRTGIEQGQHVLFVAAAGQSERHRRALALSFGQVVLQDYVHWLELADLQARHIGLDQAIRNLGLGEQLRVWCDMGTAAGERRSDTAHGAADLASSCRCETAAATSVQAIVCAYDGTDLRADRLTAMMAAHDYRMSDGQLIHSQPDYDERQPNRFPSLAGHMELRSEQELRQHKLDFLHVISDEVRNSLTVIRAYATLIRDRVQEASDKERLAAMCDYVDVIDNDLAHRVRTEQLLTNERYWHPAPVSPKKLLQQVIRMKAVKARTQGIRLDCRIALNGDELLLHNEQSFKLMVANLVGNAIKYSHVDGLVTLEAVVKDGKLAITVRDEGIGLDEATITRLLRTTDGMPMDNPSAQGVGLYMVRRVLDYYGGCINMESRRNAGTVVTITCPLALGSMQQAETAEEQHS